MGFLRQPVLKVLFPSRQGRPVYPRGVAKLALHMARLIDKTSFVLHDEALFRLVQRFLNFEQAFYYWSDKARFVNQSRGIHTSLIRTMAQAIKQTTAKIIM
jgi:hypothetical protein